MDKEIEFEWIIVWNYVPPNYFDTEVSQERKAYKLNIKDGKVTIKLLAGKERPSDQKINELYTDVKAVFIGFQLYETKDFELTGPHISAKSPEGNLNIYVESLSLSVSLSTHADIKITDENGNVKFDSKAERLSKINKFIELTRKTYATDSVAKSILDSLKESISKPENELVYLYEIREALSNHFVGESNVRSALGISRADWSELGRLSNDAPLEQGRHRGGSVGALRDATSEELQTARRISRNMIIKYLEYLTA